MMSLDNFQQFVLLAFLGLGLLAAALTNVVLRKADAIRRAAATVAAVGFALLGC